jgi:hypothetical protein
MATPQGQWLTNQSARTTPEIMDFVSKFFQYMTKGGFGQKGRGEGNLDKAYGNVEDFNYDKWAEGIMGKLQPTDLTQELSGLKEIPELLMQQYKDVLLPEFEANELNKIKAQFAGIGLHGSSTARAISEGYTGMSREAMSNYLQSRSDIAQQEADIKTKSKMSFEDMKRQAMINLFGGKPDWMLNKAKLAQSVDEMQFNQRQEVNPFMQMAMQLASSFDPYNTAKIYQQLPTVFDKQQGGFMNRNKRFVPGR